MKKEYIQLLHDLGLQESEAKVYFAALQLGPSSVQAIAKKASVSRTAAYTAIQLLEDRGIFSSSKRGKKQVFHAEKPERLLSHIKSEMRKMQEKVEVMEQSIEDIKMAAGGDKPVVRFFEGPDVFRGLADDIARHDPDSGDEIMNLDDINAFDEDEEHLKLRRLLRKTFQSRDRDFRFLVQEKKKHPRRSVQRYRTLNGTPEFHGSVFIYGDVVGVLTTRDKMVMALIENKDIAKTMRVLFGEAWENRGEDDV